jgi:hypothetical protein
VLIASSAISTRTPSFFPHSITLTKREALAEMVLQGMLTNRESIIAEFKQPENENRNVQDVLCEAAIVYANRLIAKLDEPYRS